MRVTNGTPLKVQIGAAGHPATWLPVQDFAAASRACREFIDANDLGASRWRGGKIVDTATNKVVATVSYNGRVWAGTRPACRVRRSTRLDVLARTSVHVDMTNVIGRTTTYTGDEIPGLKGQQVRIFGVMRAALLSNTDVDANDYFLTDDHAIQQRGGVTKHDRVDIAHLRADGSASFVHCDPRAIDLECFAHLGNEAGEP